ncbi:diaminobutyrate--2-oxoglutarate transaminase [Brenneria corticis]|uniref:Diaminobutyrate--2-oxoglutarate transaminase n=1 Tax=Brenneria corticis TaxID=2173106 RepID=A0A2U1U430_9GAMM|nr:diaminobutyrate--2-oxoglutarate transaminase [Brenneria sp. CFCC 11842]PWC16419.1 diaminobutyrate--2-oxoglutarate transaminase [Brenneria sp. CFCC 11842]
MDTLNVNDTDVIDMDLFNRLESEVRFYCRKFPVIFRKAEGSLLTDIYGKKYIDLVCGCGSLNFGHNNPFIVKRIIEHLKKHGLLLSLDLHTIEKAKFIKKFENVVTNKLKSRYKFQFVGPTGTNAVEASLKLARKITGRRNIISFTNAFHGMSQGSLAITGNRQKRFSAGVSFNDITRWPYDGYRQLSGNESLNVLQEMLSDPSSGVDLPAAIILETVQGEGGLNVATIPWLNEIGKIAKQHKAILIVDEIQTGSGRTGPYFSFERSNMDPDIITVAKSVGGGLPLSFVLIKQEYDIWSPGEHNGTFRGPNISFTAATAALELWERDEFKNHASHLSYHFTERLNHIANAHVDIIQMVCGISLMQGLRLKNPIYSNVIQKKLFDAGILVELCGSNDEVIKIMPALNIPIHLIDEALDTIEMVINNISYDKN